MTKLYNGDKTSEFAYHVECTMDVSDNTEIGYVLSDNDLEYGTSEIVKCLDKGINEYKKYIDVISYHNLNYTYKEIEDYDIKRILTLSFDFYTAKEINENDRLEKDFIRDMVREVGFLNDGDYNSYLNEDGESFTLERIDKIKKENIVIDKRKLSKNEIINFYRNNDFSFTLPKEYYDDELVQYAKCTATKYFNRDSELCFKDISDNLLHNVSFVCKLINLFPEFISRLDSEILENEKVKKEIEKYSKKDYKYCTIIDMSYEVSTTGTGYGDQMSSPIDSKVTSLDIDFFCDIYEVEDIINEIINEEYEIILSSDMIYSIKILSNDKVEKDTIEELEEELLNYEYLRGSADWEIELRFDKVIRTINY